MPKLTPKELNDHGIHIEAETTEIDLVCGMEVGRDTGYKHKYLGKTYHFCSNSCLAHFTDTPSKYAD